VLCAVIRDIYDILKQAEELSVSIEALQLQLSAFADRREQQGILHSHQQHLQHLLQQKAEEDALAADLRAQLQKLGDASRLVDKEMQHAQMEYQRLSNQMQTVDATAAAASAKLKQSKKDMVQALRTFSDLEAVQAEASQQVSKAKPNTSGPAATLPGTPCADVDAEVLRLSKQAQRLQAQLRRLPAIDMPQAQQVPHVQVK